MQRIKTILTDGESHFGANTSVGIEQFPVARLRRDARKVMTSRTRQAIQEWSFWVFFDSHRRLFTPVLMCEGKPFQCPTCRSSSCKRGICAHETSCALASRRDSSIRVLGDEGERGFDELSKCVDFNELLAGNLETILRNKFETTTSGA